MRVTEKGQVTIPKDVRDRCGIGPGTEFEIEIGHDEIVVRKFRVAVTRGHQIAARLLGVTAQGASPTLGLEIAAARRA